MDRVGTADRVWTRLRKSVVQNFTLRNEVLKGSSHVFDGDIGVDTVLVDHVNTISAPAFQHRVNRSPDVVGAAVEATHHFSGFRVDIPAKFRGKDYFVPYRPQSLTQNSLHSQGAVGLGGVEQSHAVLMRGPGECDDIFASRCSRVESASEILAS